MELNFWQFLKFELQNLVLSLKKYRAKQKHTSNVLVQTIENESHNFHYLP